MFIDWISTFGFRSNSKFYLYFFTFVILERTESKAVIFSNFSSFQNQQKPKVTRAGYYRWKTVVFFAPNNLWVEKNLETLVRSFNVDRAFDCSENKKKLLVFLIHFSFQFFINKNSIKFLYWNWVESDAILCIFSFIFSLFISSQAIRSVFRTIFSIFFCNPLQNSRFFIFKNTWKCLSIFFHTRNVQSLSSN